MSELNTENIIEDPRSEELQALTAHLKNVKVPDPDAGAEDEPAEIVADELPDNLEDAHALLREAQALPSRTPFESKVKKAKLARLATHIHALGQTPKPPMFTSENIVMWRPKVHSGERLAALESLAARYSIVRELLDELGAK